MIPRILHRVWLGKAPIPEQQEQFWKRWQELHPKWEFRTWRDDDILWLQNRPLLPKLRSHSSRTDIVRYEVLLKHGGVYVDTDMEPLRSLEPLLEMPLTAFAGFESPKALCTATMGAEPGHSAVQLLVANISKWAKRHERAHETKQTGPGYLTEMWRGRHDVTLLESTAFYPVPWDDQRGLGGDYPKTSFAVHHWAKSWDVPGGQAWQPKARKAALLVPYRAGDPHRDAVWAWMKARWKHHLPDVPIVTGTNRGEFNRSKAVNAAARKAPADAEVFIIVDADIWCAPQVVQACIEETVDYAVPWRQILKLDERITRYFLAQDPAKVELSTRKLQGHIAWRGSGYFGGMIMVARNAFEGVGGMDERFSGWGFEDTAFVYKMDELAGRSSFNSDRGWANMVHFWHAPQPEALNGIRQRSVDLFNEYREKRGLPPWNKPTADKEFARAASVR